MIVNSGKDYKHLSPGPIPVFGTGGYMLSVNDKLSNQDGIGLGRKGTINKPQYLNSPFWTVDTLFYLTSRANNSLLFQYYVAQDINWLKFDESTGVPSLSKKTIENITKYIPTHDEQIKNGEFFKKLDRLITLHQRKIITLEVQKKAYLNEMFPNNNETTPRLRFDRYTEEWEQRKLGEVVSVLDGDRGKNYPSSEDFNKTGHTLFLSAANVTKNGFSFTNNQYITEEKSDSLGNGKLTTNDIVITSRGSIGHIAWYNSKVAEKIPYARINSGMLILSIKSSIVANYIVQYMKSPKGIKGIHYLSFGSAQPQLTKKDIKNYKIPITIQAEQNKIGNFQSTIDKLITLHHSKLSILKKLKKAYLHKMFI